MFTSGKFVFDKYFLAEIYKLNVVSPDFMDSMHCFAICQCCHRVLIESF